MKKTQTIIIGDESEKRKKKLKPITVSYLFHQDFSLAPTTCASESNQWKFLELICRNYDGNGTDLIFAYDYPDQRGDGTLYIGQWNDGVVE